MLKLAVHTVTTRL